MSDIQAVKQRADIVDIIGRATPLQRSGRTFKACCPFHQEKTPSFVVNPERQTWHCFGACSTGGDVFQFLMRRDNLSFGEALRQLATEVGVQLTAGDGGPREDYSRLVEANEAAAQLFHHALLNAPEGAAARAYVEQRGLDPETLTSFQIGYALDSWDALRGHLVARDFSAEELVQAGLLIDGERSPYDRFRDRLIFPIRDERGRCIGFGGRVLGDGVPKYLNTPQTSLFDKSGTLYALDHARDPIRQAGVAIVVEGYMDVIAAHQHGIRNVVATLGTALTERHVQVLKRYARQVKLAMDADAAGIEAAMRGDDVVRRAGESDPDAPSAAIVDWTGLVRTHATAPIDVRAFKVSVGKDPDDAIRADAAVFLRDAEGAQPLFEFRLQHELAKVDRSDPRAMLELADRLLPSVAAVTDRAVQAQYLSRLSAVTGAREEDLATRARPGADGGGGRAAPQRPVALPLRERARPQPVAPAHGPVSSSAKQERLCLRLLYDHPGSRTEGMLIEEALFTDAAHRFLFQAWRGSSDLERIVDLLDGATATLLQGILDERIPPYDDLKAALALSEVTGRMRLRRLDERKRLSSATLHEAEAEGNRVTLAELAARLAGGEAELAGDAVAEVARQALTDQELGVRLHQLESALRTTRAAPRAG